MMFLAFFVLLLFFCRFVSGRLKRTIVTAPIGSTISRTSALSLETRT
jgi:hypothetical protein